jgi:hypothetical protein
MNSPYKYINSTGLVYTGSTLFYGAVLTGGSDAATLTLRDWTSTTGGANIMVIKAAANTTVPVILDKPIHVRTGVYATLTGTSPSASVFCDGDFTSTSSSTSTSTT